MERVQFQQEQMLEELKDLVERNLFTSHEIKQIVKKRTAFETALIRRVAKKSDFLRYATYEMGLEQLRRKRIERLQIPRGPPTVSDYALVRRQFQIFERALKRFKSDVGLWIQYIQVAKRENARSLVGRITARALQLHTNKPALYILAAAHELDQVSPSAARTILQRGIRMNPDSVDIWREYVRMELGFIENLRRRWDVLGIKFIGDFEKGKGKAPENDSSKFFGRVKDFENPVQPVSIEADTAIDGDEGAEARKRIMAGAIVKTVITSAGQAVPQMDLFVALHELLSEYPMPIGLRTDLYGHFYDVLRNTLLSDPKAMEMLANRHIMPGMNDEQLVDSMKLANEEMLSYMKNDCHEDILHAYASFVERWCSNPMDEDLKSYLILSLQSMIRRCKNSPALLATHIKLLGERAKLHLELPARVLNVARKYTKNSGSTRVWMARLDAERQMNEDSIEGRTAVTDAWAQARKLRTGPPEDLKLIWTWGVDIYEDHVGRQHVHEMLLKESMQDECLDGIHETLLLSYITTMHQAISQEGSGQRSHQTLSANWLRSIRHLAGCYRTSACVWAKMFSMVKESNLDTIEKREVLKEVYEFWRRKDGTCATVQWARWLLNIGMGLEATAVVVNARADERGAVESQWAALVDHRDKGHD